jgi:glycosyltransferase involved in cell wall biosynthesis
MNTTPLVSVIIPAYNAARYIEDTLASVIAQTIQDIEIIVVNDGSTDKTKEILDRIASADIRINPIHKSNSGVSDTRNIGMKQAKGQYLAFLDADDIWQPNKLEIQINALKIHGSNWCITDCDTMDEFGNILNNNISKMPKCKSHFEELLTWNTESFVGVMSSLVIDRAFSDGIRFNAAISSPADRDFVIHLARKSNVLYIPESLWQYRILTNSMSRNSSKVADDMLKMYEDYTDDFYGTKKLKHHALYRVNYICYRTYLKNKELQKGLLSFLNYLINRIQYSCNS